MVMMNFRKVIAQPIQQNIIAFLFKPIIPKNVLTTLPVCNYQGARTLYSANALGIEGFLLQGSRSRDEITNYENKVILKLQDIAQSSDKDKIIYTDDLKKLIALCQTEAKLLDTVLALLKRYNAQIANLHLPPFKFGPLIMRLLYIHDCPDKMIEVIEDDNLKDTFKQFSSYQLAMDHLYEKGRYEDVVKLLENMDTIPISCATLAFAAYYKMSTDEALDHSLELIQKLKQSGRNVSFRSISFAAALALQRQKPEMALEICSHAATSAHFLINNISILAKAQMGELDEVLQIFETRTLIDSPKTSQQLVKHVFCYDVVDEIEKIMNASSQLELISNFSHLKKTMEDCQIISPRSLDECVCSPISDQADRNLRQRTRHTNRRPRFQSRFEAESEM